MRWQQERFKSDSRKNLVTTKHRNVLSEVMEKSLGRCLKDMDTESLQDKITCKHLMQPTEEKVTAENGKLTFLLMP